MAANPRYAPELRLLIGGQPIPAAMRGSVTRLSAQSGLGVSDRVEVALVNDGLRWLDHPLLALDSELALSLGYAPDPLTQLFVGEIVAHEATFPSSGLPMLTVVAQDRLERLQEGTKARWFAIPTPTVGDFPLPDPAVASIVALENGLIPIIEPVGAAISALLGVAAGGAEKGVGIVVNGKPQPRPVIHGAAAEVFVAQDEAEGADQVHLRSGRNAGAGDVAGVGRDLRRQQRHLQPMGA